MDPILFTRSLSKFQNLARFIKFCRPEGKNMILLVYIQKEWDNYVFDNNLLN